MVLTSAERLQEQAIAFFRRERLPATWRWVERLTPLHQRLFAVELADALKASIVTGRLDDLQELVEGWEATAEVDAAPGLQAELKRKKSYRPVEDFMA